MTHDLKFFSNIVYVMKMKIYGVNIREVALQPQDNQRQVILHLSRLHIQVYHFARKKLTSLKMV